MCYTMYLETIYLIRKYGFMGKFDNKFYAKCPKCGAIYKNNCIKCVRLCDKCGVPTVVEHYEMGKYHSPTYDKWLKEHNA